MALKKNTDAKVVVDAESENRAAEEAVKAELVDEGADAAVESAAQVDESGVEEKAVAVTSSSPTELQPVTNVVKMTDLRDVCVRDFGTYDRLKGGQGDIVDQDDNSLGKWVELEVYSFNSRFTISPNDDDAESELCKFSLDNKILDDDPSTTVAAYLTELKKDWPKAHSKEYFEVIGLLLDADNKKETELIDMLIQVQLSPTSRKSFENHGDQMVFKVGRGKMDNTNIPFVRFTATPKKGNGKKWTMLKASMAKAREAVEV